LGGWKQLPGIKKRNNKEDHGVDAVAMIQTLAPFKVGIGIGAIALIYGTVKMEFSFGVLGFILCFFAGIIAQLFM
jgi:hypothetical protein